MKRFSGPVAMLTCGALLMFLHVAHADEERRYASYFNEAGWSYSGDIPNGYATWSGEGETLVAINCEPGSNPCFSIEGQYLKVFFDNLIYWEYPDSTIGTRYEVEKVGIF